MIGYIFVSSSLLRLPLFFSFVLNIIVLGKTSVKMFNKVRYNGFHCLLLDLKSNILYTLLFSVF